MPYKETISTAYPECSRGAAAGKGTKIALRLFVLFVWLISCLQLSAQTQYELSKDWHCIRANALPQRGTQISQAGFPLAGFMPAEVPGTVLTSLLINKKVPDPFYGMNNEQIPDIYTVGRDYYTYWFVSDFTEAPPSAGNKVWLIFRGINYSADIFLNGHQLNDKPDKGMYLRQSYDISGFLSHDGHNRLAVIVYPPDPVGKPNGGQGGDGTIAHSITNQYVAGWDWIQPVPDRNTGIWDKVYIRRTGSVHVENTHVVTLVPGRRSPVGAQKPVTIKVSTEVENPDSTAAVDGVVQFELEGKKISVKVTVAPGTSELVEFPPFTLNNPRLWWPNGTGAQHLYDLTARFLAGGKNLADEESVTFGVRELKAVWNKKTGSRELHVNGQKVFIKGGNRILSDELLRSTGERYDAEVRYHRDMNLNLIRVWGGGITERPEFYDACDKYGIMVMQDFWVSGDCNGRWYDPLKLDDTNARRRYPDDHWLLLESMADQVLMLRNHPSLVYWCGGNEIRPPADVLVPFRDSILRELDSSRFFFEFSNDDSMSLHGGDGPYTIQTDRFFWEHRSFPFNSEIGSVGIGDDVSLARFLPPKDLVPPYYDPGKRKWIVDSVWQYHKYCSYDSSVEAYGHPEDIRDFALKAQLVNYNQYRALAEGTVNHMWDWYTGVIIWKTQNPWTALVGQMYDVYLDPNACLFGLREGAKPLHLMFDPITAEAKVVNAGWKSTTRLKVSYELMSDKGDVFSFAAASAVSDSVLVVPAGRVVPVLRLKHLIDSLPKTGPVFLALNLSDSAGCVDRNVYWLPDRSGSYRSLAQMPEVKIMAKAQRTGPGKIALTLDNPSATMAFFLHISLVDSKTKKRILPVFCNNNYFSVLPAGEESVTIEFKEDAGVIPAIQISGWNVPESIIEIKN